MRTSSIPIVKDLILAGGGHSHVIALKQFGMKPVPGVRITVICREVHTPYSGMLPGFIAGHYGYDETHIDLRPLCQFAGARLYHDEVIGLDLGNRLVHCRHRPDVPFDLLSINTGSTPGVNRVPGAQAHVVPVKPISNFIERWNGLVTRVLQDNEIKQIGIVGAGAGGVELLLAVQYRLQALLREANRQNHLQFHLFSGADIILPTHNQRVRATFRRVLAARGVHVHENSRVIAVNDEQLCGADGRNYKLDEILWVTDASAPAWLGASGLAVDERGFIKVGADLQSLSHNGVFAAGDVAAVEPHPREKAGVFAVRQGTPLARNLRRVLLGKKPVDFTPQKHWLALISTSDRYAIASRGPWSVSGAWVWRWKNWIDQRFMRRFSELPVMEEDTKVDVPDGLATGETLKEISTIAMRCGGCGAKVGATVLQRVLTRLHPLEREDILVGLNHPDDAAIVSVPPGMAMVHTVDFFRAIVDDPYLFGKIAANHSLGDIFAMGAEARSALAIVSVPYGIEAKVEDMLAQLLIGAKEVLLAAGAALVGGHSSEGAELAMGFAINGIVDPNKTLHKGGMQPGDKLILTKPIGTGTLFAADMRQRAKGRWISAALDSMLQSNRLAASCFIKHRATACTDVTGFGLLGHLVEMTKASAVDVTLDLAAVPLLDGARETVAAGIFSSLQPQNIRLRRAIRDQEQIVASPLYPLLFDPQTAGGLLASVPTEHAKECLNELQRLGYSRAAIIGTVEPGSDCTEPIVVR